MIPKQWIRSDRRGKQLLPRWVDPEHPALVELCYRLRSVFEAHVGQTRAELEAALDVELTLEPDMPLARGLARLLEDRSTFASPPDVDPPALRRELFLAAAAARRAGSFDRAALLAEVESRRRMPPGQLEDDLFCDLRSEQRLIERRDINEQRLLERYNVALLQACLLDATRLELKVSASPTRLRRLLRALKFRRLLFEARGSLDDQLTLTIDGPMALFGATRQYGLALALFVPHALLCDRYTLKATLLTPRRAEVKLVVDEELGLVSHARDSGDWIPEEVAAFPERFEGLDSGWQVSQASELFMLGRKGVAVPDLRFDPPDGGQPIYLEQLGHWRKSSAEAHLERLARHGPPRYLVALTRNLADAAPTEETLPEEGGVPVLEYRSVLIPKKVLAALEAIAAQDPRPKRRRRKRSK